MQERSEELARVRLTRQEALAVVRALEVTAEAGALRSARCTDLYLDTPEARLARSATAGRGGMVRAVLRERPGVTGRWLCAEHEDGGRLTVRSEHLAEAAVLEALEPGHLMRRFPFLPAGLVPVLAARVQRLEWTVPEQGFEMILESDVHAWTTHREALERGPLTPHQEAMALSGALLTLVGSPARAPGWLAHLVAHAPASPDAFHLVWMRARNRSRAQVGAPL